MTQSTNFVGSRDRWGCEEWKGDQKETERALSGWPRQVVRKRSVGRKAKETGIRVAEDLSTVASGGCAVARRDAVRWQARQAE